MKIKTRDSVLFVVGIFLLIVFSKVLLAAECFPEYSCGEWGACLDGIQERTCVDEKCETKDVIERKFCGEFENCQPNVECTEWSNCNYERKTSDLISEELSFSGYQTRTCSDLNNCGVLSSVEERSCNLAVPISVKKTTWCNEEYVEVFDVDSNKLVSRVKETEISNTLNLRRLDISFLTTGFGGYCSYCYDGMKNYDEQGIDCGGPSCKKCVQEVEFFDWVFWTKLVFWTFFGLLLILFVFKKRAEEFLEESEERKTFSQTMAGLISSAKIGTVEEKVLERKISWWFSNLFSKGEAKMPGSMTEQQKEPEEE